MYFKASLEGQLSLKIENGISGDLMTYPRFKTYKQRYSIANLYNNVNFDGGIEVKGARLLGFGSRENPVVVVFEKANANGKKFDFIKAVTRTVIIKKNELRASNAQVTINLKDDSLFHSNIDLIYNDAKQEVILVPNNVMISNSPYYDSYHKLSISTEQIGWKIGSDQLVVSGGFGVSLNRARFESENFFNIDYFDNLMGRDQQHPVFALRNFAKKMGDAPMTAQGFATFLRKNITETKMLLMHIFYTNQINGSIATLSEEESIHCARVLRLNCGDRVNLIDGAGGFYLGEVTEAHPKHSTVSILETTTEYGIRPYSLHVAIAPTKNIDRFEWFLEKAVEIGVDEITPILCDRSERKDVKLDRSFRVVLAAAKQSMHAYLPRVNPMEFRILKSVVGR